LIVALDGLDAAGMALYAAAARARLAALDGGEAAEATAAKAVAWLAGQGVKRPERMIAMLAPGFD
jgi:hypothetical protein